MEKGDPGYDEKYGTLVKIVKDHVKTFHDFMLREPNKFGV